MSVGSVGRGRIPHLFRGRRADESGAVAVEFALIFPILPNTLAQRQRVREVDSVVDDREHDDQLIAAPRERNETAESVSA